MTFLLQTCDVPMTSLLSGPECTRDERCRGSEHPNVATSLESYAILLRKTDRNAEADELEKRARAIRGNER